MFEACITNLGKYNEGTLAYERVRFPTDAETLAAAYKKIGMDFEQYEEMFISDYEFDGACPCLHDYLGEYESFNELNYLASKLEEMESHELELFGCMCETGSGGVADLINYTDSLDCVMLCDGVKDNYDLGYYYIHELGGYDLDAMGELQNYIDYDAYGNNIETGSSGSFTTHGYLEVTSDYSTAYGGISDISDEYKISGNAAEIVRGKALSSPIQGVEIDTEENYNNIDGIRNNIAPPKESKQERQSNSVLAKLKAGKEQIAGQDKASAGIEKPKKLKEVEIG